MKNLMRASRRYKSRRAFDRLVNELFILNTAHETKEETKKLIRTNGHREQFGRQGKLLALKRPLPPNEAKL